MDAGPAYKFAMLLGVCILLTGIGAGHEIYVLPADSVNATMMADSPDPVSSIPDNQLLFAILLLGLLVGVTAALILPMIDRFDMERHTQRLDGLQQYAPYSAQATLGIGLIAFATTRYLFGPETPLYTISSHAGVLSVLLYLAGLLLLFNIETRVSSMFALLTYPILYQHTGVYALHYIGYAGLALYVMLRNEQPAADTSLSLLFPTSLLPTSLTRNPGLPFLVLRISYGIALVYAAVYAKYLHSNLALATIEHHALGQYIPVDPLFAVLSFFIMEAAIGAAFIFGIGIRVAAVLLLSVNVLTVLVFSEALWPHIWLIGGAITLFLHGYDAYTAQPVVIAKLKSLRASLQ